MLYPFGFPIIPPATPTEEVYKRLGLEELECTFNEMVMDSGFLDTCYASLIYVNEKQVKEAYGFIFVYSDDEVTISSPCCLSYDGSSFIVSLTGYKLKTYMYGKSMKNAHIMFFKKGILK